MSDELFEREGLPADFRWLEEGCPRPEWSSPGRIDEMAAHWLEIHGWFRHMLAELVRIGGDWRAGRFGDAQAFQREIMPRLQAFLQNLDGHHQRESRMYFPAFIKQEPRIKAGIELLDRDHDAVHRLLEDMVEKANAFNRAVMEYKPPAEALVASIETAAGPVERHLHDEEDIVIPLLTLHGDPFAGRRSS